METSIKLSNGTELSFTSNSIFMEDSKGNSTFLDNTSEFFKELKELEELLETKLNNIKSKLVA